MRAIFSVIGVIVALGACGRFGADNVETPTPAEQEAGVTPQKDATVGNDADAGEDVVTADAGAAFCSTVQVDFCEDWETDTASLWDRGGSDGTVLRDTNHPRTGLFALDSQTPMSNSKPRAVFSHAVESTKRKGTLSAWVWVEEWAGNQPLTVIELGMEPSDGSTARVMVQFTGDASDGNFNFKLVTQHSVSSSSSDNVDAKLHVWTKLTLDFDINDSKMKLTEEVGPSPDSFETTSVTYGSDLPIARYQVRLGLDVITDGTPTAHIFIDDVTLSLQ